MFICYGTAMEHRSVLNRSGICDGINRCNIFFVHAAVLSIKTVFNLVKIHLLFRNMGLCTMSFKCIRQHAMLSLFLEIVHSSEVADDHFNIEYEKRIAGHSTNIALHIVSSTLHCPMECVSQHMCCCASIYSNTGSCNLNSHCSPQLEQYSDSLIIKNILSECKSFNLH